MQTCNGCRKPSETLIAQPRRARPLCPQCDANKKAGLYTCLKCGIVRPLADFNNRKSSPCRFCAPPKDKERLALWREARENGDTETIARLKKCNRLRREYGITLDEYETWSAMQGHACAICAVVPEEGLVVDHSHDTDYVRGLLCRQCNAAIGLLGDKPSDLMRATSYLCTARLAELGQDAA